MGARRMRFEIRFLDMEKYPIDRFIDGLYEDSECKQYHISVSFLDHRKNSAILLATGEFAEYIKTKFSNNKSLIFTLPSDFHNPFHTRYLDKEGWMICGCGWKESPQEHTKRIMVTQPIVSQPLNILEMKIVSRSEV